MVPEFQMEGGKMPRKIKPSVDGGMHRRQADTKQEKDNREHYRQLKERLLEQFATEREAKKQATQDQ